VAALTGPLLEVAAGRGGAVALRGEPRLRMTFLALHALEQSVWSFRAAGQGAQVHRGGRRPAVPEGESAGEDLPICLHASSAATLGEVLHAALGAADSSDTAPAVVALAAELFYTAAMAGCGLAHTRWCRDAIATGLPSLLLRAAVQLSAQHDDPISAANAAIAACLMLYTQDAGIPTARQGTMRDRMQPQSAHTVSRIRARALDVLVVCAGGGCPEAAAVAVVGAQRICDISSGCLCAADLAARPGAATAVVGALLRCADAARVGVSGGICDGLRMADSAGVAGLLLSEMAAAACQNDAEAQEAAARQGQRVASTSANRCDELIEAAHAAAEAALLRLGAGERGGALAADAAAALGFLRRRKAPPPLPGSGTLLRAGGRRCLACGKGRGDGLTLRRCNGCRAEGVFYCSVEW
jgi:hypothetical protein